MNEVRRPKITRRAPIFTPRAGDRLRQVSENADAFVEPALPEPRAFSQPPASGFPPAPPKEKRRFFAKKKVANPQVVRSAPKEIELKISLPKFKRPKLPKVHLSKKTFLISGSVVTVALIAFGVYSLFLKHTTPNQVATTEVLSSAAVVQEPSYKTILPTGKTIQDLGGWGRVSPPDKDPVFAYADKIDGVQASITEQPLPDAFKSNTDAEVAKLAKQFSATDKVISGAVIIYLGTSVKGPQSAILTKGDLLILIKSNAKIANQKWADYVATLK
jgi:hypothetical protein